jgi:hypothetical protein
MIRHRVWALVVLAACQASTDRVSVVVPNPLPSALLAGIQVLWAELVVEKDHEVIEREPAVALPTDATDTGFVLEFSGLRPGTYAFRVRILGSLRADGEVDDADTFLLLEYVRDEAQLQPGKNGTLIGGGTWEVPDATQGGDLDDDGVPNLVEIYSGLDPTEAWSKIADAPAGETILGMAGDDSRAFLFNTDQRALRLRNQELIVPEPMTGADVAALTPRVYPGAATLIDCGNPCAMNEWTRSMGVALDAFTVGSNRTGRFIVGSVDGAFRSGIFDVDEFVPGAQPTTIPSAAFTMLYVVPNGAVDPWTERYTADWLGVNFGLGSTALFTGVGEDKIVRYGTVDIGAGGQFREETTTPLDLSATNGPVLVRSLDACGGSGAALIASGDAGSGTATLYVVQSCPTPATYPVFDFASDGPITGLAVFGSSVACHALVATTSPASTTNSIYVKAITYDGLSQCYPTGSTSANDGFVDDTKLPATLGAIATLYVGESMHATYQDGSPAVAAYVADTQGHIFVSQTPPDILGTATPTSWEQLPDLPVAGPIVAFATDRRGGAQSRPADLVASLYAVTAQAIYRFP